MPIPRYAAKVDRNQADIMDALRSVGCSVLNIKQPVDLAVGLRGQTFFLECKVPKAKGERGGELTPAQVKFLDEWRGHAAVVETPEQALRAVGVMK